MTNPNEEQPKIVDLQVQKRRQFGALGTKAKEVYEVTITTARGNSGQFTIPADTYENDEKYAAALLEAAFQLDKAHYTPGLMA